MPVTTDHSGPQYKNADATLNVYDNVNCGVTFEIWDDYDWASIHMSKEDALLLAHDILRRWSGQG